MQNALKILFIEDDTIENMKFNRVLNTMALPHHIMGAKNGEEALDILNEKVNLPHLIVLDLNMPKMNGIEFLTLLKNDAVLKQIPAIILTTSNNHKDLKQCYQLGIAGYILKPLKYEDYVAKIQKLLDYWGCNELIAG